MNRDSVLVAADGELAIRQANVADARLLTTWWNDGQVMAHAGFPEGIGTSEEEVAAMISHETDENRRMILELAGRPIGEMNYRTKGAGTAEIGIKICDFSEQEKGYGTRYLRMLLAFLFGEAGYDRVILDTKMENKRAQHVYEQKIGFRRTGATDKVVAYELTRDDYANGAKRRVSS